MTFCMEVIDGADAVIGGIVALWLTGEYLSVPASVGFINLYGVAVLNGIVLVSYFNKLREDGLQGDEAIIKGTAHFDSGLFS